MGSAWLTYTSDGVDHRVELDKPQAFFGRASGCDVAFDFRGISRLHFKILQADDQWEIEDSTSRNGTYVNGRRVWKYTLQNGDQITFGAPGTAPLRLIYHDDLTPAPRSTPGRGTVFAEVVDEASSSKIGESLDMRQFLEQSGAFTAISAQSPRDEATTDFIGLFNRMGEALLGSNHLEEMLQRVLDLTFEYLPASRGSVCMYDVGCHTMAPVCARLGPANDPIQISRTIVDEVADRHHAVLVGGADDQMAPTQSLAEMDVRSAICAPMYHEGQVLGLIYLDRLGTDVAAAPFHRRHLDTLSAISVFTAAGVQQFRLREDLRREQETRKLATSQIHALLEVARSLSSELETTPLLELIMQRARELIDAERCTLFLIDRESGELWSRVADGTGEIRFPMNTGLAGHVAMTGELLNIPDCYQDERFNPEVDRKTGYVTRNMLCLPMRDKAGDLMGVAQMLNKRGGPFLPKDEVLLHAFAGQAAVALENAMLFQRGQELNSYLESILQSITNLVLTLDDEGKLVRANRPTMSALGLDELVMTSRSFSQWFGPGVNEMLVADIQRVYDEPNPIYVANCELQAGEHSLWANYNVVPLLDFQQAQKGVVVVLEDITKQKRMIDTLGRYFSPQVAQKVMEDNRLGGVRQKVAVLFSDIRGYTPMTESMDAGAVVELLNEYFSVMVDVIFSENGVLDKYIGDGIMAVFGVPYATPHDSFQACTAALRMLEGLETLNKLRATKRLPPIRIGVGINTGAVVSGNIGSEKRLEYTCIGDGVNLASRLEGVTKQYGVTTLLSEYTVDEVRDQFVVREIDSIRVVGMQQPVRIFELLGRGQTDLSLDLVQSIPVYASGLQAFREGKWSEALEAFEHVLELREDGPSRVFVQRCQFLRENPPEHWSGVWDMTSK